MKLSQVKGERVFDVIAEIIEPVARIAKDNAAKELFEQRELPEGMTKAQFFLSRVEKSVPALIRGHKDDLVLILSAIEGTDKEEYLASLNIAKLVLDVKDLITDEEFLSFLE